MLCVGGCEEQVLFFPKVCMREGGAAALSCLPPPCATKPGDEDRLPKKPLSGGVGWPQEGSRGAGSEGTQPARADHPMSPSEPGRRGLERDGRARAGTCLSACVLNTHVCGFLRPPGYMVGGGCLLAKGPVRVTARGQRRYAVAWNQVVAPWIRGP